MADQQVREWPRDQGKLLPGLTPEAREGRGKPNVCRQQKGPRLQA